MKIIALLTAAVLFVLLTAPAGQTEEFDFRRTLWGMTPEEVRASETKAILRGETEASLLFQDEVAGAEARIIYLFDEGGLVRGVCALSGTNQDEIIGDYYSLRHFLTGIHGEPAKEEMNLRKKVVAAELDPADHAALLSLVQAGGAEPVAIWQTDSSDIYLLLTEKDGRAAVEAHYLGRNR